VSNETINPEKFQSNSLRLCGKKDTQFAELKEHEIFKIQRSIEVLNSFNGQQKRKIWK